MAPVLIFKLRPLSRRDLSCIYVRPARKTGLKTIKNRWQKNRDGSADILPPSAMGSQDEKGLSFCIYWPMLF